MQYPKHLLIAAVITLGAFVPAQTQLLRGKVEDVSNTTNQFFLDGTRIDLVSSTLNLNALVGQQLTMQVIDVSQGGRAILDVRSATPTTKMLDMGNLRFGRAESWQVNGVPGSRTGVFLTLTNMTSYVPFGASGTWVLGGIAPLLASGTINAAGQYEFKLTTPNIPSLVGVEFTSQAAVIDPQNNFILTNPDSKEVRAN
jgi:hypothetical protein